MLGTLGGGGGDGLGGGDLGGEHGADDSGGGGLVPVSGWYQPRIEMNELTTLVGE